MFQRSLTDWRALALVLAALFVPACGGGGGGGRGNLVINPPPGNPPGNKPPGVAVISPDPGSTVIVGSAVTVEANVTDADGFVTLVEFFDGATLIGQAGAFPFRILWQPPAPGSASLTAVATDNSGASTISGPVQITILPAGGGPPPPNRPPTVSITSPSNGSTFETGTSIDVQIQASDPDGSIVLVDLFEGSHHIGSATQAPVHITWTPTAPGVYSLHAVATDDDGVSSSSSPVTVTIVSTSTTSRMPQ